MARENSPGSFCPQSRQYRVYLDLLDSGLHSVTLETFQCTVFLIYADGTDMWGPGEGEKGKDSAADLRDQDRSEEGESQDLT